MDDDFLTYMLILDEDEDGVPTHSDRTDCGNAISAVLIVLVVLYFLSQM